MVTSRNMFRNGEQGDRSPTCTFDYTETLPNLLEGSVIIGWHIGDYSRSVKIAPLTPESIIQGNARMDGLHPPLLLI